MSMIQAVAALLYGQIRSGKIKLLGLATGLVLLLSSCHPNSHELATCIWYSPPARLISCLSEPFPPLRQDELAQDWGKELQIGLAFAREMDLYRAITAFKRALVLMPAAAVDRRLQIEYSMILAYYLGGKYQEAIEIFEESDLTCVGPKFPAFETLLTIIQDAYRQDERGDRAAIILEHIRLHFPERAADLELGCAIRNADIPAATCMAADEPRLDCVTRFVEQYCCCKKSVTKAQWLNGLLPGAGYYYVGQKKAALTSFMINALFSWAAYEFFHREYYAAGAIATSLEMGWYFGGINGAGLAAKEFNEQLYNCLGKEAMLECRLFPVLMLGIGF